MAEAMSLASENFDDGANLDALREREDRVARHLNRLDRYNGVAESQVVPNPERGLRWPGLQRMAESFAEI